MDNCSHNGDKVKAAVFAYASKWVEQGLVPAEFLAYVKDETKTVSYTHLDVYKRQEEEGLIYHEAD